MRHNLKNDKNLNGLLLVEQYKQAAEEYRAEYRFTWQIFAIIVAINGTLFGLFDFNNLSNPMSYIIPVLGIFSSFAGVNLISRSRLYQRYRIGIAENIQTEFDLFVLYSNNRIYKRLEDMLNFKTKWYRRLESRWTMLIVLALIGLMWSVLLFLEITH